MKHSKGNYELYLIIAIIILSMAQGVWLFKGHVFDNVDSGLQSYLNFAQLSYQFYMWSPVDYTGFMTTVGSSVNFALYLINALLFIVFGWILSAEIWYGLLIAAGNLGMFFLVYKLLDGKPLIGKTSAGFFAIALYGFYAASSNGPGYGITGAFLPVSMLFALLLAESLNAERKKGAPYTYLALLSLSLSLFFAFGGGAYIIQNVLTIAFPIAMLVLFAAKSRKLELFWYYLLAVFVSALIVSPIFISTEIFTRVVGNQFFNSGSIWIIENLNHQNLFSSLQLFAQSGVYLPYYAYEIALILFAISSLVYLDKKNRTATPFIIGAFVSLFVLVSIWNNFSTPFGSIFNVLLHNFKELLVFRYSGSSLYYCVDFVYAVLAGFGIGSIYESITKAHRKKTLKILSIGAFLLIIVALIFLRVYYNDYINYASYTGITVPNHVYKISNYINSQKGDFNVGLLPVESPFMHFDTWYSGTDIYTYFINNPAFTGGYVAASELFFPPSSGMYLDIGSAISEDSLSNRSLTNALDALGIGYIVVQGDTLHAGDERAFSFNSIYKDMNESGLDAVFLGGNSSVYKNPGYDPLVYASDMLNIGNSSVPSILSAIENATFEVHNDSVFSTYISDFYNDSNTINATSISNFAKPDISFVQNTPTKVTVHVSNATTPYYLVFRETYDPHWAAFYSNGTEVNPRDHIAVNGFANAWYMNKTGNYTITLYYTLQTEAWLAWGVSFAALFVTIGIGVYGWKGMRKEKRKSAIGRGLKPKRQ